jgi:hypothetical protein
MLYFQHFLSSDNHNDPHFLPLHFLISECSHYITTGGTGLQCQALTLTHVCACDPSDTTQNDPEPLVEIEGEELGAVSIPVWLSILEVEAAALSDESE